MFTYLDVVAAVEALSSLLAGFLCRGGSGQAAPLSRTRGLPGARVRSQPLSADKQCFRGTGQTLLSHHPSAEWGTRTRAISLTPGLAWGPQQPLPHTAPSPGDISDSWDRAAGWGRAQNQHGAGGVCSPSWDSCCPPHWD